MTVFRALGVRVLDRRGPEVERRAEDLSTFSSRDAGVQPDALAVSPPRESWPVLKGAVPGILIQGGLPEDPEARFVLRLPEDWNGRLVVSAAPGLVSEFAYDVYWSDYLLPRGYAFACTDKGAAMQSAGDTLYVPLTTASHIRYWPRRLEGLALHARERIASRLGKAPERIYAVGVSNGGYLVRRVLEDFPKAFDGGVDVSGVLWRADGTNLLDQLPAALRAFSGGTLDPGALEEAGFAFEEGLEELYSFYRSPIWELVLMCFLESFDPDYRGAPEDYRPADRPESVREAVREIENTGDLKRPLRSVYGKLDPLLPPGAHFQGYADLVRRAGKGGLHALRAVDRGSHNDFDKAVLPSLEPLMPAAHEAFEELVRVVEGSSDPAAEKAPAAL